MCGIVGIIQSGRPEGYSGGADSDAAHEVFLGLTTLQHRGQDAAGILSYDETGFHQVKNIGLVENVFTRKNVDELTGSMAIGHARYSTIGRGDLVDVQPFLMSYPFGIGMVHNGNIVNCQELAGDLLRRGRRHLLTHSDSEIVLNLFAEGLAHHSTPPSTSPSDNWVELNSEQNFKFICGSIENIFERVNGSYSIATLIAGQGLVAFRDPQGIRPLIYGKKTTEDGRVAHMVASESVALLFLGYEVVRDIAPGEVLFIDTEGVVRHQVIVPQKSQSKTTKNCMFEWVYFASPESVIDEAPVYGTRIQLGKNLAQLVREQILDRGLTADIVVPVPETSRIAAIALAEVLDIPYREVLIKNRYIKRTFILDSQEKRQKAVNLKLSPVRSEIEGRSIILVDDSIVRGTTSRKIIELVRNAGAKKVYFVSTCPPIRFPCFYGIDFPDQTELIAAERDLKEIEKELGADAVIYLDIPGLERSIDRKDKLCMACLDGNYPSVVSRENHQMSALRKSDRKKIS